MAGGGRLSLPGALAGSFGTILIEPRFGRLTDSLRIWSYPDGLSTTNLHVPASIGLVGDP